MMGTTNGKDHHLMASAGSPHRTVLYWFVAIISATLVGFILGTPAASAADTGYRDFSFNDPNVPSQMTGEKPQSKLWIHDGTWWGSLFNNAAGEYRIYRYDRATHTWSDTGTPIDVRNYTKADTLWEDGKHLYVASAGAESRADPGSAHSAKFFRYSYDAATKKYSLDSGFPVTVSDGRVAGSSIVLDKEPDRLGTPGKLWVTYIQGSLDPTAECTAGTANPCKVYVRNSQDYGKTWGAQFVLPVAGTTVRPDDISSVVAFDSQIGVMWSNQKTIHDAMYFATHKDGDPDSVWQGSQNAIQGPDEPNQADDHISLRSLKATDLGGGRVFAAVKTSSNDVTAPNPNKPLNLLLVRDGNGNWTNHVFGTVGDNHTRPIVMLDENETRRDLYMFATAPCCDGGAIYYKKTSLDNVSFSTGLGTPFIQSTTDTGINDATSTKQNVSSATGLVVMASSQSGFYWHNAVSLPVTPPADTTPPETTIASGPSEGSTVTSSNVSFAFSSSESGSSFECSLDGVVDPACTSPKSYTNLSNGSHTFSVKATDAAGNTDPTPASRTWTVNAVTSPSCTQTGTANSETISGTSGADVICAGGGNDTVKGLGGGDTLKGEAGNDTLLGGGGADAIDSKDGVNGNDSLNGGAGTDTMVTDATEKSIRGIP